MDLKAIEAALAECLSDKDEDVRVSLWRFHDLIGVHGPDLLRLVRVMRWMEENEPEVFRGETTGKWICDGETGDTMLDAIEAAIVADQQTKGESL